MKTTKTKEAEVKEKRELKEALVLWKRESEKGGNYLSGHTKDGVKLIGFFNTNKDNPKAPDIKVYTTNDDGKRDLEVASLWENVSEKTEKHYLSGSTNEKEKLVGFYNDIDEYPKAPYIRVFYQED